MTMADVQMSCHSKLAPSPDPCTTYRLQDPELAILSFAPCLTARSVVEAMDKARSTSQDIVGNNL